MQVYEMPVDMVNDMLLIHMTAEEIKSEEMVSIGNGSFTIFILKRKKLTTYFPLVVTCRLDNYNQSIICVEP